MHFNIKVYFLELCCLKLGNIKDFLHNCIFMLTDLAPRFASNEKFFDMCVMVNNLKFKTIFLKDVWTFSKHD